MLICAMIFGENYLLNTFSKKKKINLKRKKQLMIIVKAAIQLKKLFYYVSPEVNIKKEKIYLMNKVEGQLC